MATAEAGTDPFRASVLSLIAFGFPFGMALCSARTWWDGRDGWLAYAFWTACATLSMAFCIAS